MARFAHTPVAVLAGGPSSERAVSQVTGAAVAAALTRAGYTVAPIDPDRDLPAQLIESGAGVVYNALHGTLAEDGRLQGLLDWMGLPYTGEDCRTSVVTFDKVLSRAIAEAGGLPIPAGISWPSAEARTRTVGDLPFGLPVIVKPAAEGSSVGVTLVEHADALPAALAAAATGEAVVVEAYVKGPELSVGVVAGRALGVAEIVPKRAFYDYEAKYGDAGTEYFVPARITRAQTERVLALAERAVALFGCRGAVRVDFLLGADGPVFLEVNTLPGLTPSSLMPKIAAAAGLAFDALVVRILESARCGREVPHGA